MTETDKTGADEPRGGWGDMLLRWQSLIGALFGFAGVIITLAISAELALDQERLRDHLDRRTAFEQSLALSALLDAEVRQRGNTLCAIYTRIPQQTDLQGTSDCPALEATTAESPLSPLDVSALRAWTPLIEASADLETTVYFSNLDRLEVLPPESVGPILDYYSHLSSLKTILSSALGTHDVEIGADITRENALWPTQMNQLKIAFIRLFEAQANAIGALERASQKISDDIAALPIKSKE